MGPKKDRSTDVLKSVKDGNREKLLKALSPERTFSVSKMGVKQDSSIPGGRIRLKLTHLNINCHEDGTGYTPLIIAVLKGNKDMVEDLVFHSADVNCQDGKGNTPLHMAVFGGKTELVDYLLLNHARVDIQNSDGNSPLHIICQVEIESRVHIMLKLLQNGAALDLLNKDRNTALDVAATYNKSDAVSVLLDHSHGEDGSTNTRTNSLAMIEAAIRGYKDVVEMFLDYGYDPNVVNKEKDTTALIEAVRFMRFPVVESLLKYGAKPDVLNGKKESAETVAKQASPVAEKFQKMFEEYKASGATQTPRYLKILSRGASLQARKDYPELPNDTSWTKNSPEYCNSCTPNAANTNILGEDRCKGWIAAEIHHAWTVLDLKHNHTITGMTIYGWDSPQMVNAFQLQKGPTVEGPWSEVLSSKCLRMGNTNMKYAVTNIIRVPNSLDPDEMQSYSASHLDPTVCKGTPQTFTDFNSSSRFWRFELLSNHGGQCICVQGIKLFGADERIKTMLAEYSMDQYGDDIIGQGFNTYKKFLLMQDKDLQGVVDSAEDRAVILKSLERDRPKEFHPATLTWKETPITKGQQGEALPPFSVKSRPGIKTKVQVVVEEGVNVTGETVTMLQSDSLTEPSFATFRDITFHSAGRHRIVIQCVDYPRVTLETPQNIEIKPKAALRQSVAMAFDDMEAMLKDLTASLGPIGE